MIDHNVVGLDISVHDAFAVTVIESLEHRSVDVVPRSVSCQSLTFSSSYM